MPVVQLLALLPQQLLVASADSGDVSGYTVCDTVTAHTGPASISFQVHTTHSVA